MAPLSRENSGVDDILPTDGPMPLEIVFSFDTTGSMGSCILEVRKKVQEIMERLNKDIPGLRMAVFAHGDYCDAHNYVTKWLDFTTNVNDLCDFVKNVSGTGGGDFPECYELVLRQVREELSWTTGTQRSLVMIGDAIPHEANDAQNKQNIDWKEEVERLYNEMGVQIYSVQCNENNQTEKFFSSMATVTNGKHLKLQNFETIVDIMMSIVFRERGAEFFEAYEKEVREREGAGIRWELERMFKTLGDRGDAAAPAVATVPPLPPATLPKPPATPKKRRVPATPKTGTAARKLFAAPLKKVKAGGITKRTTAKAGTKKLMHNVKAVVATPSTSRANTKRVLRENVTDCHLLHGLQWSKWNPAFTSTVPRSHAQSWKERRGNHDGYRCTRTFADTETPAMYELSVQTPEHSRKVPVWRGFTNGFEEQNWDTYFLRSAKIQGNIDDVLQRGCKLHVRRATEFKLGHITHSGKSCSTMDELKSLVHDTYDYAWSGKTTPRHLFPRRSRRSAVLARKGQPY